MTIEEMIAAKEQRCKEEQEFHETLVDRIETDYGFSEEIAKACVDKGWEDGHASGYGEIRVQSEIAADFVKKILSIIGNA